MKKIVSPSEAESFAIETLVWMAQDKDLLPRFLALTGIEVSSLRQAAQEPGFLAGVLQFFLNHEPTLRRYCEETGTAPELFSRAAALLPGGASHYESSI